MDGYDRAVMLLVDELLPEYEFEYEITDFSSPFSGLDSGRYAAIVDNLSWKEERAARYLYSNEYYLWTTSVIAYQKGRTDITYLEDLCGKSTVTPADGAGRAICSTAAYHGAEKIYVTDIFAESAQALARDINAHFAPVAEYIPHGDYAAIAGCTMVVNATGIGMGESIGQTPLPEEYILRSSFILMRAIILTARSSSSMRSERAAKRSTVWVCRCIRAWRRSSCGQADPRRWRRCAGR